MTKFSKQFNKQLLLVRKNSTQNQMH